ncbi:adenine phosphoribosyltransferase [Blochmannia endosymbiont of Camponotus sp. C-003]|uniref:adenine phosphoribosyltransferase n=1 Tax=unclassified Candidatus Blochmanniella TaxID=711328 RepID=UPI00202530B2|nr:MULTISPECIES: adenine phosphoribosyltransferase [unclassified Candidatus Blochmannia]URJ23509.1 adenine phosphoribosyltransferase [Blochmannia endosymbiont of Camponotus sp. C-003]URJ28981.1 adenine phosphoribosyltransferase [Blochmannia endosymbiont of Camponotus sp. C-046]
MIDVTNQQLELIKKNIKFVPNYPKKGILFRDITALLKNPQAYSASVTLLAHHYKNHKLTKVVGIEARGFLFSAPLALILKLGFIPARKSGRLPRDTIKEPYILEYDSGSLEIHTDAITPGDKVLIIDDLLATGGTIAATVKLIRRLGGEVNHAGFIIDLENLSGKSSLKNIGINSYSLVTFSDHD